MNKFAAAIAIFAGLIAAGPAYADKLKKVEPRERDAFSALRVYLSEAEEKAYLKLKTPELRDAWLKEHGTPKPYWDLWYKLDAETQEAILSGDVAVGWTQEKVFMAWGEPAERFVLPGRMAERSEMFVYRFEVDKNGDAFIWVPGSNQTYKAAELYQMRLTIDDARVTEMERKKGWE